MAKTRKVVARKKVAAKKATKAKKRATNAELEAQILNGDDLQAHAVYGDWLTEQGDPRGELVAVQLALEASPDDAKLRAREQKLRRDNAAEWLGTFAKDVKITWRRGFIDSVCFEENASSGRRLHDLAKLAGTQFVRSLELCPEDEEHADAIFDTIAEHGLPPATRSLGLVNHGEDPDDRSSLGNHVESAYRGMRKLHALSLEADWFHLGHINLPELRSLELITTGFRMINLVSIVDADWPVLERLSLWIGNPEFQDVETTWADYEDLLSGKSLPAVRELGLCGRDAFDVLKNVIDAPILRQLRILDISHYSIEDSGVTWLRKHAAKFAHLAELRLPEAEGVAELADVIRVVPVARL